MKERKNPHSDKTKADKPEPLPPLKRAGHAPEQKTKMDSSFCSERVLQKLSAIEDLLKRKDDKPLTFKDACSYLGYAPSYLYKLTYKNIVPHYKPTGKIIFFSKNELDEWIFKSRNEKIEVSSKNKDEDASAASSTSSEYQLTLKDPNQIEMELQEEVLIEFPLKSRRKQ